MRNRTMITLLAAAAIALLGATTAEAHGKAKHARKYKVRVDHPVVRAHAPVSYARPVIVPRRIVVANVRAYRPYFVRNDWVPSHRHVHAVYGFPVATRFGIEVRSFSYCNGHLVGLDRYGYVVDDHGRYDHDVDGFIEFRSPHVSFGVGF